MLLSCHQSADKNQYGKITWRSFENVAQFKSIFGNESNKLYFLFRRILKGD
jgi:hypothetical protein